MNDLKIVESGLVPIYEYNEENAVDARELYEFLQSKQDFSEWIKNRIEKFGFVEDVDFTIILGKSTGGRPRKDYILTMDLAKELSMVENNDQGRKARQYFIKADKRLKQYIAASQHGYKPYLIDLEKELLATQYTINSLKVNEGSKVLMLKTVYKNHNISTNSLPVYTEEKLTRSLTQLLKEHEIETSARTINKILKIEDFLIQRTRPSSKNPDNPKKFWQLTEKGLEYGKNLINPNNPKETQPHYFEDSFMDLMKIIGVV